MRSKETDAYDLMEASSDWEVWVGTIVPDAQMSITCNECRSDAEESSSGDMECNLNGVCIDGECECNPIGSPEVSFITQYGKYFHSRYETNFISAPNLFQISSSGRIVS